MRWWRALRSILLFAAVHNPFAVALIIGLLIEPTIIYRSFFWPIVGALLAYSGLAAVGAVLAPMLQIPRRLLNRYETRKVRLLTDKIDGGIRQKVAGALSHPERDDRGSVSLPSNNEEPEYQQLVG